MLGIAGVAGSGQRELLESIAGLYPVASGHVTFYPPDGGKEKELVGLDPMKIRKSGISMSFVPEDRLGMGLVGSMGMTGNMMLRSWRKGKGLFLNRKDPEALANRIWEELGVVTPSTSFPVRRMSGGNVQKVLVGREIAQSPAVLMTAYAVRGLDINTSYTIYNLLTEQKMKGVAVVYVGEDLDVLLELCDRIVVLCGGQVSGVVDARNDRQARGRRTDDAREGRQRRMNKKQSLFHIAKRDTLPWYKAVLHPRRRDRARADRLRDRHNAADGRKSHQGLLPQSSTARSATSRKSWVTFQNLAILLGISLAVTPAFKMRFWNIGAEGQVLIGCLATAACMICLGGKLPNGLSHRHHDRRRRRGRRALGLPPRVSSRPSGTRTKRSSR